MNNNFIRQGQGNRNNRNRNRSRNNNRSGSSGNNGGGGNSSNKVFDSNGPDVKLRGTAQTVAEKYMQLGRDAQSSGDSVSAESYYQHAEHYYRVWASSQPVGSSLIMSRKLGEDEFEEEGEGGENENAEPQAVEAAGPEGAEGVKSTAVEGQLPQAEGQRPFNNNRNNNNNNRNNNNNNGRERFRPRWQQRNDRYPGQPEGTADQGQPAQSGDAEAQPAPAAEDNSQWEAPSFLQRPTPVVTTEPEVAEEPAPRRGRSRRERAEPVGPVDEDTPENE